MPTRAERFAGLSVALVTPFRDGILDTARLAEQIDFQAAAGTTCICPVGTTGESPTLSHDEHERVIAESVQAAAGRMLVMPGTGSNSTAEAVRLTKFAARAGADAALVVGPYYNRPTQRGIEEHYKALAESVENSPASRWSKKLPVRSTRPRRCSPPPTSPSSRVTTA